MARNLFFKHYTSNTDAFMDYVVKLVKTKDDSLNLILPLVQNYGIPLWQYSKSIKSTRNVYSLTIPVKAFDQDSLTSLLIFTSTPRDTKIRVFEKRAKYPYSDKLKDIFLHYESTIFKGFKFATRKTVPVHEGNSTKCVMAITTCFEVYTSLDLGATWSYSYTSCGGTTYVWIDESDPPSTPIGGGYPEGGGGDGTFGGDGGGSGNSEPTVEGIDQRGYDRLTTAKNTLETVYCPSKKILESEWNNYLTIQINSNLAVDNPAAFNSNTNTIQFRNSFLINDSRLLHETFHAFQDTYWGGGNPTPPTQMAEFETFLFVDLYRHFNNQGSMWASGLSDTLESQYLNWLESIEQNGVTNITTAEYSTWFNRFISVMTNYSNLPIGSHTSPSAINSVFELCHYNN
ncbi:MAG: hypothetical protein HXX16_02820 [Bacteroidales bacterium]|nr:hypothetical protein [Bacteroidales bacterium]